MQDFLEPPPKTFFKPASFNGGSQRSDCRGSPNNHFFNAFKKGFQNGQKSLFSNDDEKSLDSLENIRRRSPGEWNEGFYPEKNRAMENLYEVRDPQHGLRRISPMQADKIQDQQEIQLIANRYAAFGARPFVRSGEQHGQPHLQYPIVSPMDQKLLSSNRKGGYKDSKKLFVFLWVLIFLFIALGGLSIGLGLYYGLSENQTPPNQVNLDFKVVNATFDANLTDKSSSSYSNWKTRICDACTNLLKNQNSQDSLVRSCSDISFKQGSIKVSLNLVVSPGLNKSEVTRRLNESFPDRFLHGYECRFETASTRSEGSTVAPQVSFTTTLPPAAKETTSLAQTPTNHSGSPSLPSTAYHVTSTETHNTSMTSVTTTSTTPTTTKTAETATTTIPTTITSQEFIQNATI